SRCRGRRPGPAVATTRSHRAASGGPRPGPGRRPGSPATGPAQPPAPRPRNSPSVNPPAETWGPLGQLPVISGKSLRTILRVSGGPVDLSAGDPADTPRAPGGKRMTRAAAAGHGRRLAALQEALYAEGSTGYSTRRVLLVLQGMDTSGKDGAIKHVVGMLNPQGCRIVAFREPTEQERAHHFLWRIRREVPPPGLVGVFNRSHYEDVLVAGVHQHAAADVME